MVLVIFNEKCLEYEQSGHPESAERVKLVYEYLKKKGLRFKKAETADMNDILLVHTREHVESVRNNNFFDPDTPNIKDIYYYASLAAGSAIIAMKESRNDFTFSLARPPGHHASKTKLEGFCYFNNIAISVEKAIRDKEAKKVAILDIDVHHGNGTQAIFYGRKDVLYISLHQYGFIYPGTGGHSSENCINFPLHAGTGEKEYMEKFKEAVDLVKDFKPEMLAISAGFDTYRLDPLASLNLEKESYSKIAKEIKKLGIRSYAVLEGGYSKDIALLVHNFIKVFT